MKVKEINPSILKEISAEYSFKGRAERGLHLICIANKIKVIEQLVQVTLRH